jgi:hypothetical protein
MTHEPAAAVERAPVVEKAAAVEAVAAPSFRPGLLLAVVLLGVYGGLAVAVDFPRAAMGIQSDEATYYMMGHSLARDGDLTYRREDLVRVWEEFPSGPTGLFLKKGTDVLEWGFMRRPPFLWTRIQDDPVQSRLFYGKSFIYAVFAAPFVKIFGTNGFLVLHALLLGLVVWCAFLFLHARMRAVTAALLSGAFVMATVVPVYFVWITPELFNFSLGLIAYFCWLYKEVAPPSHVSARMRWLLTGRSDLAAAVLLGIATFSKPWSALLFPPMVLYLLWRRRLALGVAASAVFLVAALGLFGINIAISGEWNYQGGQRNTYYWEFPFQTPASGFDVGTEKARDEALTGVIFDPSVVWTNLAHNLLWFFVGRNAGLVAYFFPAVFALGAFALARKRPAWQYFVLLAALGQILIFIISVPYTWNGGGGSVGNRYFMGAYGAFFFLIPVITRTFAALLPWFVGLLFMAPLVLNPFVTSFRPADHPKSGPFRWLPVELTLVYDWPLNTQLDRVRQWFGNTPPGSSPGFQIYFLDDNAYNEGNGTFWVKGKSRAEFVIKTDRPMKRLLLTLTAGPQPVRVDARLSGRSQEVSLGPDATQQLTFTMGDGFPYQGVWPVWKASISASTGFVPIFYGESKDTRHLGVRVTPTLVE